LFCVEKHNIALLNSHLCLLLHCQEELKRFGFTSSQTVKKSEKDVPVEKKKKVKMEYNEIFIHLGF
jgi:hypothetical protein